MRVLYLHQYFVPPTGSGGTRSWEFSRRLVAAGHTVHMVTSSAFIPPRDEDPSEWGIADPGRFTLTVLGVPYGNRLSYAQRARAFVSFAARASLVAWRAPADVVFATSTPLTIAVPALVARTRWRIPMVFEVRDLWPDLPVAVGALRNPLLVALARLLERVAYRASAAVIALSPGIKEAIVRRDVPGDRVTMIPNGCDLDLFARRVEDGADVRARLPERARAWPLVVYAGAIGRINGVPYLAEVARCCAAREARVGFLVVGDGSERDALERRAEALGVLGRNLWVWGSVPKSRMPAILAAGSVCTSLFLPVPGMEHNSANKFFDALAAGRPVAVNYGGWHAELLEQSGAGLVLAADDPEAAARQLVDFVTDSDWLARASAAARRLAETQFSRDLLAAKLERVLRHAVANGRTARDDG